MRLCDICDGPILQGEPREFVGDDIVHGQCSVSLTEKPCPHPCNLIHSGSCNF